MSKVKQISIVNLKALSAITADFNGCSAIVTGGNNRGKSTLLRSLPDRIRGAKPDLVLKHGAKEGSAELTLTTGERFQWTFDGKKEKLTYISERNIPQSVTKDLARIYFPPVFDVDDFLAASPAKQKATLQKLTGIDFTEIDNLYKGAYDDRTYANKKLAEAKALFTLVDPDLPAEEASIDALLKELAGIDLHNAKIKQVTDGIAARNKSIEGRNATIAALEAQISALKEQNDVDQIQISDGLKWLDSPKGEPISDNRKFELELQIAAVRDENKQIAENNKAKEQEQRVEKARLEAERLDAEVKRIEAEKLEVIKNASMPDGFGFDDEGITYNGFAFNREQLSSSAIYIAALKLAAIGLGDVKMLHFDASFLDKESLGEIEVWANSMDLQLLIEKPSWEPEEIKYELINEA